MFEPVPPNYYISIIADRWLHAETRLPISFKHLILPETFPQPTALLELQPLPLSALHNKELEALYSSSIRTFNKIQTQVFPTLPSVLYIMRTSSSAPQLAVGRRLVQSLLSYTFGARQNNLARSALSPSQRWSRQRTCSTHWRDECGSS